MWIPWGKGFKLRGARVNSCGLGKCRFGVISVRASLGLTALNLVVTGETADGNNDRDDDVLESFNHNAMTPALLYYCFARILRVLGTLG